MRNRFTSSEVIQGERLRFVVSPREILVGSKCGSDVYSRGGRVYLLEQGGTALGSEIRYMYMYGYKFQMFDFSTF